jgi:hypothetical protein
MSGGIGTKMVPGGFYAMIATKTMNGMGGKMENEVKRIIGMPRTKLIKHIKSITNHHDEKCWLHTPPGGGIGRVTLVSHIDTVHDKFRRSPTIYHDREDGVLWSPEGLGADDRAGVYASIRIYRDLPDEAKPNLLFCDEEEKGGIGAQEAAEVFSGILEKTLFFIGLDRRDITDAIFYNEEPKLFRHYIESYGFREDYGTYSDTTFLGAWLRICAVNLSIGYINEHTDSEMLFLKDMYRTIRYVQPLIIHATSEGKQWENPRPNGGFNRYRWDPRGETSERFYYPGHWRHDVDGYDLPPAQIDYADEPIPVDDYIGRGAQSSKLSRRERRRARRQKRAQQSPFHYE